MLPYVLLIAVPLLYYISLLGLRSTYHLNYVPYRNSMLKVFFVLLFVLLTLRAATIGVDTQNYLNIFHVSAYYSLWDWVFSSTSEIGYLLLVRLIRVFTNNEQIFLAVIAAIILIPVGFLYSRESDDPILTMLLFLILPLFGMFFSGFRQSIAIAISVPAYYAVKNKQKWRFILFVLLALLFHRSSFIVLLLYPIYHMKLTTKKLIWIVPLILVIFIFNKFIFESLLALISLIYGENDWVIEDTSSRTMLYLFIILLVFSYIFVDEGRTDQETIGLRNILVLVVIIQTFASVNILAMRMNYYFILYLPLLIPKVIWQSSGKNRFTCIVTDSVMCIYFLYYFLDKCYSQSSAFHIYPYIPFWV